MDKSLDDLIKERAPAKGGKGSGGAVRKEKGGAKSARAAPYAGPTDRRGRGSFRYDGGGGGKAAAAKPAQAAPASNGVAVHVGNLPWSVGWKEVKAHLAEAGDVTRVDVAMRDDGTSRGFATAYFATQRGARTAIATLHESELGGRQIVLEHKTGEGTGAGGGGGREKGGGAPAGKKAASGRGAKMEEEGDGLDGVDGYSYSGSKGRNGWVKPAVEGFVDEGPPPEPKTFGGGGLRR